MRTLPRLAGLTLLVLPAARAAAADRPVQTAIELESAVRSAQAGDVIRLAPGSYALAGVSCSAAGTEAQPITVRADPPGMARIDFDALEGFKVSGAHWHFEDLEVHGVCAQDSDCEHAFHVTGAAVGFQLKRSKVVDFNAQLKVNAERVGGVMTVPDRGLVEDCELYDTRARNTGNPVTKLNVDTGDDWVLRGNFIHDHHKGGGNNISYGAFLKSGGKRGLMEQNLVICTLNDRTGGTRIGLSLGGGGTGAEFCAPAFDPNVPCDVEHEGGTLRNNVIIGCSDVGIYLNRAKDTRVLFNTLIGTSGVDFRFDTTSGQAIGNALESRIRMRDGATFTAMNNLSDLTPQDFAGWYTDPLAGDLRARGDLSRLIGQGPELADVPDDYCARARPAGARTLGAIEHSLGDCPTGQVERDGGVTPGDGGMAGADAQAPAPDGGGRADATAAGPDGGAGAADAGAAAQEESAGCGCTTAGTAGAGEALLFTAALLLLPFARRQRSAAK